MDFDTSRTDPATAFDPYNFRGQPGGPGEYPTTSPTVYKAGALLDNRTTAAFKSKPRWKKDGPKSRMGPGCPPFLKFPSTFSLSLLFPLSVTA